jgi:hypothetical protein
VRLFFFLLAIALGELIGLYAAHVLASSAPVSVVIEPGPVLPSHGTARLRVTVEPNASNRGVWMAIEASGYAAASYEDLDGAHAARTRWATFKDLPDGSYMAWVRVLKEHGETSASVAFTVGAGEEEQFQ